MFVWLFVTCLMFVCCLYLCWFTLMLFRLMLLCVVFLWLYSLVLLFLRVEFGIYVSWALWVLFCVIGGLDLFGAGCLNLMFVLGLVLVWLIVGLFAYLLMVVCSLISWCLLFVCLFDGFGLRLVNSVDLFYFGYFAFVLVLFCDYCFVYWLLAN